MAEYVDGILAPDGVAIAEGWRDVQVLAGAAIGSRTLTVPAGEVWRVLEVTTQYAASSTVGTRHHRLSMQRRGITGRGGLGTTDFTYGALKAQAASTTYSYTWSVDVTAAYASDAIGTGGDVYQMLPLLDVFLMPGESLQWSVFGNVSNDVLNLPPIAIVERYPLRVAAGRQSSSAQDDGLYRRLASLVGLNG